MNEELQKALTEILNGAMGAAGQAKDFLQAELPEVIQQLLLWKAVSGLIGGFFALIAISGWIWAAVKVFKAMPSEMGREQSNWAWQAYSSFGPDMKAGPFIRLFGSGLLALVSAVFILPGFFVALQIWLAPKVYLIEYAASLAK